MDFYVDAVQPDNLKLVPREAYETIVKTLVRSRRRVENDTEGKFMHIATLAEGEEVTIRSLKHPERSAGIERFQAGRRWLSSSA